MQSISCSVHRDRVSSSLGPIENTDVACNSCHGSEINTCAPQSQTNAAGCSDKRVLAAEVSRCSGYRAPRQFSNRSIQICNIFDSQFAHYTHLHSGTQLTHHASPILFFSAPLLHQHSCIHLLDARCQLRALSIICYREGKQSTIM